jgi:acyl carrier protein phosphodiesterase
MNYLAHSILSFTNGQLVGNMIADFIRIMSGKISLGNPGRHKTSQIYRYIYRFSPGSFGS